MIRLETRAGRAAERDAYMRADEADFHGPPLNRYQQGADVRVDGDCLATNCTFGAGCKVRLSHGARIANCTFAAGSSVDIVGGRCMSVQFSGSCSVRGAYLRMSNIKNEQVGDVFVRDSLLQDGTVGDGSVVIVCNLIGGRHRIGRSATLVGISTGDHPMQHTPWNMTSPLAGDAWLGVEDGGMAAAVEFAGRERGTVSLKSRDITPSRYAVLRTVGVVGAGARLLVGERTGVSVDRLTLGPRSTMLVIDDVSMESISVGADSLVTVAYPGDASAVVRSSVCADNIDRVVVGRSAHLCAYAYAFGRERRGGGALEVRDREAMVLA